MKILIKGLTIGFSTNCKRWMTKEEWLADVTANGNKPLPMDIVNMWTGPVRSHNKEGFFSHVCFD